MRLRQSDVASASSPDLLGTITLPAGTTRATIDIKLNANTTVDALTRALQVALTVPSGTNVRTIGTTATITLHDED